MNNDSKGKLSLVIKLSSEKPEPEAVKDASEYKNLSFIYDETNTTASVAKNSANPPTGALVIPAKVMHNGEVYEVTRIWNEVTFGGGTVTAVGGFVDCTSLQSVHFPASFEGFDIGHGVKNLRLSDELFYTHPFEGCTSLTSITVDENNPVFSSYKNGIYKGTELVMGLPITEIKEGTTKISYAAFCTLDVQSITIPASVTSIGDYAFVRCNNLTTVTFANPNGWSVTRNSTTTQLSSTDLSNTSTAAKYLRDTYKYYTWTRS